MVQNAESLKSQFTPEQQAEFLADYKLKEDPRVTKIGRFLRKSSLDELPQLFNVLRGEMSLIGPRPVTQEELSKYDGFVNLLLTVRPGITGLWQVSGRNDISYEERVQLDINYILNCNWTMDCKLMLDTIRVMLFRLGAY
jgi:undecaprenyl-phosphate galactose phosphotransferase